MPCFSARLHATRERNVAHKEWWQEAHHHYAVNRACCSLRCLTSLDSRPLGPLVHLACCRAAMTCVISSCRRQNEVHQTECGAKRLNHGSL